jgi:hypothetical protein
MVDGLHDWDIVKHRLVMKLKGFGRHSWEYGFGHVTGGLGM